MRPLLEGPVTVREAPGRGLTGGYGLAVEAAPKARLDADDVVELRDTLTDWLRQIGRDR